MINYIYFTYIHKCIHNHNIKINRWFNDQLWSFYILGSLAWPLSTFSVNLPSLKCMTNILVSPSIRSLSLIPGLLVDTLLHDPEHIYNLVEQPGTDLISTWVRVQFVLSLPSPPCVPYIKLFRTFCSTFIDPSSHHPHP